MSQERQLPTRVYLIHDDAYCCNSRYHMEHGHRFCKGCQKSGTRLWLNLDGQTGPVTALEGRGDVVVGLLAAGYMT